MKTAIISIVAVLILVGCRTTPETRAETIYEPVFPPEALTRPCYPIEPERPEIGYVIASLYTANEQCNNQLKAIRQWKEERRNKNETN